MAKVTIENFPGSPYSQSAKHDEPHLDREAWDDYDERTWRRHCTVNAEGQVCIPAMAPKQALDKVAFKLGIKVPNRRGALYKSFFASGFFCNADAPIANGKALTPADAVKTIILANSNGIRGSGKRVPRRYPDFPKYRAVLDFTIVDDIITEAVFEQHLRAAGVIVGLGRFRPENGGTNGRFRVIKVEWEALQL
jgi:hypothetical protein